MDAAPTGSTSVVGTEVDPGTTDPSAGLATRSGDGVSTGPPRHRHSSGGGGGSPVTTGIADAEGAPFTRGTRTLIAVATIVVIAASLVLRFWTKSDLWLDEALTVNIAGQPLHQIPSYLKRDGAPPLYYVLLHFWMGWFGHSDEGIRSMSGVFGVVTVPLAWLAGKRIGGPKVAWAAMLLVATSPFAIRYDTENRMYALVVLLTVLGFLALDGALRRPRPGNLVGVALITGLLLYTHYWSLYLIGTMMLWLVFQAIWGRPEWRRGAKAAFIAGVIGCLTFVPWLPTFLYQSKHTGTPWATPANFAAMVNAVSSFAGGGTNQGRALGLIFFALAGLGLFGVATGRSHIDLDIRTRPLGRPLAIAVVGTLAAAITGGLVTNSAFDARYASVVFIPLILLVSIGLLAFLDRRVRTLIIAIAVVAGLASSIPNVTTNRTQAGQVARAIAATGHPGDIVAYCPDQLGPAVNRLLPTGRYLQTTFPRGTGPAFINWVDYGTAVHKASPLAFAEKLEAEAASSGRQIYLVWASGYQTYGVKCEGIVQTLQADPAYHATEVVVGNSTSFYQPMWMVRFTPTKS